MIRAITTLVVTLFAAQLAAATISGTVRDAATGSALSAMTIQAYDSSGVPIASANTTSGTYTLTVTAGSYRLLAFDPARNYATAFYSNAESFDTSATLTLGASSAVTAHFSLASAGRIAGSVRSSDGVPLAKAVVTAYNESGTTRGWTQTDASGGYQLVLPPGGYRLAAWDEPVADDAVAYIPLFNGGARTFATAVPIAVAAATEVRSDFMLPRAGFVTGTVVDEVTRAPLGGMVVDVWTASGSYVGWVVTSSFGSYRVALESGSYRLAFSDQNGVYAPTYLGSATSFAASPVLPIVAGEERSGVGAALVRGGKIAGRITDARSGSGIVGISVAAWNPDGSARTVVRTNQYGDYVLVVPAGVYRIGAFDQSLRYSPRFIFDTPDFAQAATLTVFAGDVHAAVDLALRPVLTLRRRSVGR